MVLCGSIRFIRILSLLTDLHWTDRLIARVSTLAIVSLCRPSQIQCFLEAETPLTTFISNPPTAKCNVRYPQIRAIGVGASQAPLRFSPHGSDASMGLSCLTMSMMPVELCNRSQNASRTGLYKLCPSKDEMCPQWSFRDM